MEDEDVKTELAGLCRFFSKNHGEDFVSFDEYIAEMKVCTCGIGIGKKSCRDMQKKSFLGGLLRHVLSNNFFKHSARRVPSWLGLRRRYCVSAGKCPRTACVALGRTGTVPPDRFTGFVLLYLF